MIAVILCTRGLVFTRVEEAIEQARKEQEIEVFRSWDLKIPDCQNSLVEKALLNPKVTHLLFVEEDTVPPEGFLKEMLALNTDIACLDYGVSGWSCVAKDEEGRILWCGLGCTLIKKEVFEKMPKPWFRTDKILRLNTREWLDIEDKQRYGGQDIWFCCIARELGFEIKQIKGECEHLKLESLGVTEVNNGLHKISLKSRIEKQQVIEGRW